MGSNRTVEMKPRRISLLAGMILGLALSLKAADAPLELTFPQFRDLVRDQSAPESPGDNRQRAAAVFFQLLVAQGREAAARQSLDRLSGWVEAAQARLEAQNVAALDVEWLRYSQEKAAGAVARLEAEHRRAWQRANALLKRSPDAPLRALIQTLPPTTPDETKPNTGLPPAQQGMAAFASRKAHFEKVLLPQGRDLLARMYQSYLFGGLSLSALLWQEGKVYKTELQYRLLLAQAERRRFSPQQGP